MLFLAFTFSIIPKNTEKIQFKNTIIESNPSGAVQLFGQHFLYHLAKMRETKPLRKG